MIPSIVCCFRSGGDYLPKHVLALRKQIEKNTTVDYKFVCYSDVLIGDSIPLKRGYPGWWSCVELWRATGPSILLGLDTIILGNIDGLLKLSTEVEENEFLLLDSPFHAGEFVNGIQVYNGDWSWLYENFNYEKESAIHRGDENYLINEIQKKNAKIGSINKHFPGIYNYKRQYKFKQFRDAKIIYFHGRPRPWQTRLWRMVK